MKKITKTWFRLIAKSLGEKSGKDDTEADKIAIIRIFMFLSIFITNGFIVYGVIKTHMTDGPAKLYGNLSNIQKVECVTPHKLEQ